MYAMNTFGEEEEDEEEGRRRGGRKNEILTNVSSRYAQPYIALHSRTQPYTAYVVLEY
jgi:hypothetical protein